MTLFVNVVVMLSSCLSTFCFVDYKATLVCCIQVLYCVFLFLSVRVVYPSSYFVLWPWCLLFWTVYKGQKAWKVFFNFFFWFSTFFGFQPFGYTIQFLRNWQALSYQSFNLFYILLTHIALVQTKEEFGRSVGNLQPIVH